MGGQKRQDNQDKRDIGNRVADHGQDGNKRNQGAIDVLPDLVAVKDSKRHILIPDVGAIKRCASRTTDDASPDPIVSFS
jgi:hypothetical protein